MKVLFVAMSDSVHAAKWIGQLNGTGWKIYLYPAFDILEVHEKMPDNVIICVPYYRIYLFLSKIGFGKMFRVANYYTTLFNKKVNPNYYAKRLSGLIKRIRPDILHSMETQGAGYLVLSARGLLNAKKQFPKWWHSNWGSDISLFGRLPEHQEKIREVLSACDYYSCECLRDVKLGKEFGFKGEVLPVYPNAGGFPIELLDRLRTEIVTPSHRKVIMLKGYQGLYGRALVGIRALERCADVLKGYKVVIYTNNVNPVDIQIAGTLFSQSTGIEVTFLPSGTNNEEILYYHGIARISIGLCICDGVSTSVLEAMAMGSFPIQSDTSCAGEWITDGESGFIVPPEDPEIVEQAIRKALSDNDLVDHAARINYEKIRESADYDNLRELTHQSYLKIQSTL